MPRVDRHVLLALLAAALAMAALAVRLGLVPGLGGSGRAAVRSGPAPALAAGASAAPASPAPGPERVVVHVVGAVRHPGVLRLRRGARAVDAVRAAGGATRGADLAGLDLAAVVVDGEQVVVPSRGGGARAQAPATGTSTAAAPTIVHLNAADVAALDALPGVGPATAARIIAWREQNGGFRSVDDLGEVPGIGPARLDALRALVAP